MSPEPSAPRGGSAGPKTERQTRSRSNDKDLSKSKSLPPNQQQKSKKISKEVSEEEKLKRLSSPEREKFLQRKKKFETNAPVKATGTKKIISLKRNEVEENNGKKSKDNSEGADDNLDMFEEEKSNKRSGANNVNKGKNWYFSRGNK